LKPKILPPTRKKLFNLLNLAHQWFFSFESPLAKVMQSLCLWADQSRAGRLLPILVEDPLKGLILSCQKCGDCAIVHTAFLCPESQCPKHIRNGACGGSLNGMCEVFPDRRCIWYRAFNRLDTAGRTAEMVRNCIPPRMWELNNTSSWINFYLRRDHQSAASEITAFCSAASCRTGLESDSIL
jgi:methylenetetrahydrofolate reductase (NADPH)